ncbi:MAG: putative metal-binding motif-containing protein, partial [Pseudomonadota bacterium]|nr:putative metal-binding motif-containing protein [Pseudomonadota bacterium]
MPRRFFLLVAGSLALAPDAFAANVLYCNDYVITTDRMGAALTSMGTAVTVTSTTSITTCESSVTSRAWDLVILAIQNNSYSTPNFNSYVAAGGAAILQDWTKDATRGSRFGVTYSGSNLPTVTVTDTTLASGLASNPFGLTNPGWGTWSMPMIPTTGATSLGTFSSNSSIVLGSAGNTIVNGFLTDTGGATSTTLYVNEIEFLLGIGTDADGDGYTSDVDCDDANARIYPGATERCNSVDDDCDGAVDEGVGSAWYEDADGDDYGDPSSVLLACSEPSGYVRVGTDCDDTDASINPAAAEYCNGINDDCDGSTDESAVDARTFYWDADGDLYGNSALRRAACTAPTGYVSDSTDCNDSAPSIHPGATEVCNGLDDDCDTSIDEGATDATLFYADADADTYGDAATTAASCSAPSGYTSDATDCDDRSATVHPGAEERCNGIDDDCDALVDDNAEDSTTWYEDVDGDAFGDAASTVEDCAPPTGYTGDATDCDDLDSAIHPGAPESCNGVDD